MNNFLQHIHGPGVINSPLPFSPAIRAGDFVFVSGMASADENGKLIPDTFENEARRTYENIKRVLAAAGLDFPRVVQVRCYLSDKKDWDDHNRIYREYFKEPFPARTTLIGCLGDFVKYEVDCVAYAGNQTIKL
jgi:2-iminobutanoate/2-iminopropanoate deaminase